jgi:hypothetical protein
LMPPPTIAKSNSAILVDSFRARAWSMARLAMSAQDRGARRGLASVEPWTMMQAAFASKGRGRWTIAIAM